MPGTEYAQHEQNRMERNLEVAYGIEGEVQSDERKAHETNGRYGHNADIFEL